MQIPKVTNRLKAAEPMIVPGPRLPASNPWPKAVEKIFRLPTIHQNRLVIDINSNKFFVVLLLVIFG